MIFGIGTDLVDVERIETALARHGPSFAHRILAPQEREGFQKAMKPAHYVAKRFAAKEAFGKALGTGVAQPATLHSLWVMHDERGKPFFGLSERLSAFLDERSLHAHLSVSDEGNWVLAFCVLSRQPLGSAP
jgi:holo-[acyl-carrier protein] synthase